MAQKKSFKDDISPAMQFISVSEEDVSEQHNEMQEMPMQSYKLDWRYIETKSRRVQLLIQPSLHDRIRDRARKEGKSVNELIHSILNEYV